MGGHGGLNILPQKRWNVYNYDNRAKVERDKRKLHERRNQELESQIKNESTVRIQELREKQQEKDHKKEYRDYQYNGKSQQGYDQQNGLEKAIERHQKYIERQEKKETSGDSAIKQNEKKFKEVNLFTAEEEAHNQEIQRKMDIQSQKYFEGKPFEMDTKFGGNFKNQPNVPWYASVNQKPEGEIQEEQSSKNNTESKRKEQLQQEINAFRKNTKKDKELFKVIDDKLLVIQDKEESIKDDRLKKEEKERKHRKNEEDQQPEKHKKIKKDKKTRKDKHKHKKENQKREEEEENKMLKLKKLRDERIKREQQERLKQRELFRANPMD